jgi:predicted ATP-binding protein involved in virulence
MQITRLNLTNYRGVHSLSLDFQERLNVFFGVNGAGKSTILDAVAIMLSWAVSRIRYSGSSSGRPIQETDITNGKSSSSVQLDCIEGNQPIEWRLSKSRGSHQTQGDHRQMKFIVKQEEPREDSLSENEMRQFVSGYLQKGRNGMYGEFWMTIRYLFGGYATA